MHHQLLTGIRQTVNCGQNEQAIALLVVRAGSTSGRKSAVRGGVRCVSAVRFRRLQLLDLQDRKAARCLCHPGSWNQKGVKQVQFCKRYLLLSCCDGFILPVHVEQLCL